MILLCIKNYLTNNFGAEMFESMLLTESQLLLRYSILSFIGLIFIPYVL
jgi:hypothetical protein